MRNGTANGTTTSRSHALIEMMKLHNKGFKLCCPSCGETEVTMTLSLTDLSYCKCSACDDEFAAELARDKMAEHLRLWEAVCRIAQAARGIAAEVKGDDECPW